MGFSPYLLDRHKPGFTFYSGLKLSFYLVVIPGGDLLLRLFLSRFLYLLLF
jgi:hypothetical protein